MTWFADLTPYSYLDGIDGNRATLNVGWLDGAHPFPQGEVPAGFSTRLGVLIEHGRTQETRGLHYCELCPNDEHSPWGSAEIRAVGVNGTRFAAPTLIHHYVIEHRYTPPRPFVEAVLRVSVEWEEAIVRDLCMSCGEAMQRTRRIDGLVRGGNNEPVFVIHLACASCGTTYSRAFPDSDPPQRHTR